MAVYTMADVTVRLTLPCPLQETENFSFYRVSEDAAADVLLTAEVVEQVTESSAEPAYETAEMRIRRQNGSFTRYFFDFNAPAPYAALYEEAPGRLRLRYRADKQGYFRYPDNFFRRMGLEQVLLHGDATILHASYLETPAGALLFSGPSGIGKSTQAALWEQHAAAHLVNGDRAALRWRNGILYAYGLPYAGSSNCFRNVTLPVRAIVRLSQAANNTVTRLSPAAAFRFLYEQTTVNVWNENAVRRTTDLVGRVCEQVPVYHYACTKEPDAVATLRAALAADGALSF